MYVNECVMLRRNIEEQRVVNILSHQSHTENRKQSLIGGKALHQQISLDSIRKFPLVF